MTLQSKETVRHVSRYRHTAMARSRRTVGVGGDQQAGELQQLSIPRCKPRC